ncbi:MAG: DUF504 domain-containing protein [Thiobacillaceae bacterium]|nr:DUF504 domain-containing protein [Thiobacillaceae bacterium]
MTAIRAQRQPPIHELLQRIRWDPLWRRGDYVLGYWDRVSRRIQHVALAQVLGHDRLALQVQDRDGRLVDIPYHRILAVWRDGRLIWQRARLRVR